MAGLVQHLADMAADISGAPCHHHSGHVNSPLMPPLAETGLLSRFDGLYRKGRSSCIPLLVMRWDRMTQSTRVWLHAKHRPEFKVLLTAFGVFMVVSGAAFPVRRPDIYTSRGAIPCSSSLGL